MRENAERSCLKMEGGKGKVAKMLFLLERLHRLYRDDLPVSFEISPPRRESH